MTTPLLHGLPPIVGDGAELLILGNMPGVASLAAQQYYAHSRNAFWRITGDVFGFDPQAPYDVRTAALRGSGVAVWDVLKSCRRVGSLDSAVQRDSMVPNDFASLFGAIPTVRRVLFNGAAAEANFDRLVKRSEVQRDRIVFVRAPSTSPAQTMRYHDKLETWRRHLTG